MYIRTFTFHTDYAFQALALFSKGYLSAIIIMFHHEMTIRR